MPLNQSAELIKFLLDCQALKFGDFTLKSGAKSPFFIDLGQVKTGRQLDVLGGFMAAAIRERYSDTTIVFGPAYKGIALAATAATAFWRLCGRDLGVLFDRKEAKAHGEGGSYIGNLPTPADRIVLIDDVLTSGQTKREAIASLQKTFGVTKVAILVVVDRRSKAGAASDDLEFSSLLNIQTLGAYLVETGDDRAALIKKWWETAQ
ncbi:MAG: orotate phosphoribosyltransferase [Candidatus Riflebacteria bacterium HGW-Riflebacteria-1]|jgi:orotate phosphoribosyltransferase|nr:MAG: orotate phosphoribosyltransferase [Candidatus Riflebacteria bacterium HGW-Riflebacteria-1]